MLGRVRRGDLLLAAVALTGVVAGLVLTVAAKVGVTGPVLVGAGIVAAVAAAIPGVRTQASSIVDRQRQQRDRRDATLKVSIGPLGEVDPFSIGVFSSALADAAQQDRTASEHEGTTIPPYVPRGVDEGLRHALEESSLARAGRLVVLRGDPKSGKSRTLWEAVRVLPGRRLLAVIQPDPAAGKKDPAYAPLATLAGLDRPVSRSRGRDLVIWVDDAQAHLQRGLTRDTLRRLAALYPGAIIALTIHSSELNALRDIDPPLHQMLRRLFDDLIVTPTLSHTELDAARAAYPALSGDHDLVRLPELFAAVNLLTDRYQSHRADEPTGVAVAKAAVDWQRAGMPPGSIDEPTLRALAALTLADIAPNQLLDAQAFERGLAWATNEVAAFAALVRREHLAGAPAQRFRAFDAVVSWAQDHDPPLGQGTWNFVLAHASDRDRLAAGVAAYQVGAFETAISAFEEAARSTESSVVAQAHNARGVALSRSGQPDQAVAAYDEVIERFASSDDPALAWQVAVALINKGVVLDRVFQPDEAVAAYDQLIERYGSSDDPALAELMATALVNKGVALGESDDGLAAFDEVIERFGGSDDPVLARSIANAFYNKGLALGRLGRPDDEIAACDELIERFSESRDPSLAETVARALSSKAAALGRLGRLDDEIAAYDEVIERFSESRGLSLAETVATALLNKGAGLGRLVRYDDELAAYDQLIERYGSSDDPALADIVAKAQAGKEASLPDREPRALFNLGLVGRLRLVRQTYMRKALDEPHNLAQTVGSMIGEVVGRDALCNVIIEELNDPGIRRPHVVIGGVGAGKTALLVRLTKLLAERGVVPVPVRLRDAQESLDFRELARTRFVAETNTMSLSNTERETVWRELWRNDEVVVLADGLEEALIEGNARNERDDLIRIAIRQASAQRLPLVITSRPHDSLRDMEAAVVELEPLSEEAALEYVGQWESGEDSRRLGWIVETADVVKAPLYLQITRQLYRAGLIEYVISRRNDRRLDTRSVDREELRLWLLQSWMAALIEGHFLGDLALNSGDRRATVEQLSLLACVGLQQDGLQVRFDQAESLRADSPPAIVAEVDERLGKLKCRYDLELAAAWGTQLGLVEARGEGVRFPHGIMQAYLASRLIDVAMADPGFRDHALANSRREFLIALVMHSRARLQTPRSDGAARGSRLAAQPGAAGRTPQEFLCREASRRTDAKALDLYAAALQIDSVEKQPAHSDIAEKLEEKWPDIRAKDQRTLEEAKLNVVHRFGETARTISEQRRRGQECRAEPGYLQLYRIGCFESSYPIRLACAQEIGAGGDNAFDALAATLGPPVAEPSDGHATAGSGGSGATASASPPQASNLGPREDQEHEDRAWKEGVVRAWLAPLLAGSVTERKSPAANDNLEQWLQYLGERTHTQAESDLRLSLEVALAQGFKHAANRRRHHPHARPEARVYLAEQARQMLRDSRFWFTRLTLLHALCLWSLPDGQPGQRHPRDTGHRELIKHWIALPGSDPEHPFVIEASQLAVLALETGQPERFIWIDDSGVVGKVGSGPANPRTPRKHNLWIPPSTGWTALHPRAQQLVADVLLLLNLAERGGRPSERNRRLHRTVRPYLPPCLGGDRSPLDPTRTMGTAETPEPGSNCKEGCPFELCPYPLKGETSYRIELSEAFCRGQQAFISSGSIRRRAAPWQQTAPGSLKQFWKQMEQRAQSV